MRIRFSIIREVSMRHPGMWDEFMRAGKPAGMCLEISRESLDAIQAKYFASRPATALHDLLAPGLEIIDSILGTELTNCDGCAGRELQINSVIDSLR